RSWLAPMSCDAGAANRGSNPVAPTRLGILLGQFHLLAIVTLGPLITVVAKPRRGRPRLDHQTITIDSYTTSIFLLVEEVLACPDELRRRSSESGFESSRPDSAWHTLRPVPLTCNCDAWATDHCGCQASSGQAPTAPAEAPLSIPVRQEPDQEFEAILKHEFVDNFFQVRLVH